MKKQLLAIRWVWYTPKSEWNSGLNTWMSPTELMRAERDAEWERSCEVEYQDGLWWAGPDNFGLVLDSSYPIRKVWASDVHTYIEDGILIPDDLSDPKDFEDMEVSGWDEAYQKFLEWRPTPEYKAWWAEATFPAKPPVVAFARPQGAGKNWKVMHRAAVKAFGDLPIIDVAVHPDAQPEDVPEVMEIFKPFVKDGKVGWWFEQVETKNYTVLQSAVGLMDDYGTFQPWTV